VDSASKDDVREIEPGRSYPDHSRRGLNSPGHNSSACWQGGSALISKPTQDDRILHLLQAAWPSWTPAPALSRISLQYGSRVHSLRRKGFQISNKIEIRNGVKHGYFRLGSAPLPSNRELRASQQKVADALIDHPDSLFGSLTSERHRDDG
jgi:hypothetical protein